MKAIFHPLLLLSITLSDVVLSFPQPSPSAFSPGVAHSPFVLVPQAPSVLSNPVATVTTTVFYSPPSVNATDSMSPPTANATSFTSPTTMTTTSFTSPPTANVTSSTLSPSVTNATTFSSSAACPAGNATTSSRIDVRIARPEDWTSIANATFWTGVASNGTGFWSADTCNGTAFPSSSFFNATGTSFATKTDGATVTTITTFVGNRTPTATSSSGVNGK